MRLHGLKREIAIDAGVTLAAMALAVVLAWMAAGLLHFDIGWRLHVTALAIAAICGPIIIAPLVHANRRLAQMKRELERIAHADPLTGLPNRRAFFERANAMFAQGTAGAPLALMMVDIDRFKAINDEFGHDAGDAVLQTVGTTIAASASGSGARAALAARIGGEEFAVAVGGLDARGVAALADRLCANVRRAVCDYFGTPLTVTVSVGFAMRAGAEPVDVVLKAADTAVYEAKHRGRDRWQMATRLADAPNSGTLSVRGQPRAA